MFIKKLEQFQDEIKIFLTTIMIFSYLIIEIGYLNLNYKNIIVILINITVLLLSILLYLIVNTKNTKYILRKSITNRWKFLLIITVVIAIVELYNFNSIYNLRIPIFYIFNLLAMFITLNLNITNDNRDGFLKYFSKSHLILMSVFSLFSILILLLPHEIIYIEEKFFMQTTYSLGISLRQQLYRTSFRLFSMFENPSHFGEFGFLSLFFYFIYRRLTEEKKYFYLLMIAYALFFSQSRTALLASFLFLFLYFIFQKKNIKNISKKNRNYFFIGSFLIILLVAWLVVLRGGFDNNGRFQLYRYSTQTFLKNPLLGVGIKNFYNKLSLNFNNAHAHNSYLQLLGSGGLFYFIPFVLFIIVLVRRIGNIRKTNQENERLATILLSFIYSALFFQLFDNKLLAIHYQFQIFLLIEHLTFLMKKQTNLKTTNKICK